VRQALTLFGRRIALSGLAFIGVVGAAAVAASVYAAFLFYQLPSATELADYHPPTATRVYASDGTLIGEFSKVRRIYVPYGQIPPRMIETFLAAEDHNFFHHGGVDPVGLSRAMIKDVFNVLQGRRPEGGSTITQQVAKNILLNNQVSVGRKLKEAILAGRLEQTLSKPQILELYLNEIWLGYRSYGVGAAAYNYFGKSISDLSLAQMAYLAALPKGPDNYQPVTHKAAAIRRRNMILTEMADLGWVTRADADAAMAEDLKVETAPVRSRYRDADYFVAEARRQALLVKDVGDDLNQGGYYMRTTLDPRLQTAARIALMDGLETYDHRHGWRGAWGRVANAPGWQKEAMAHAPPSERRKWQAALVLSAAGAVRVQTATDNHVGEIVGQDVAWARAGRGLHAGDLVFVEPADTGGFRLRQIPLVNGALVAMDPASGRVLAMVGGYSFSLSNFNRATQAYRQPGSAFKPFVYATALESGLFTPASIIMDGPITLPGANGQPWSPENYEKYSFRGPMVFRRGLELSLNTMTVRIAMQVGMRKIVDTAKRFGVVDRMAPYLPMALGAGETTPFRMAGAYSSFVNGGRKVTPHLIELVEDRDGDALYRADARDCGACDAGFSGADGPDVRFAGAQIIDPITAYQIETMLEGVVQRGTGVAAQVLGRPIGGKTGTTNDFRSAWFVGFSPRIVVATYIGFDDDRSLGKGETGAVAALPIFIEFMQEALKGYPSMEFKAPPGTRFAYVGPNREAFRPGTEPRPQVAASVDVDTGASSAAVTTAPGGPPAAPPPPNGLIPPPPPAVKPPKPPDALTGLY
jgi:penicillin-binding protein 1A